MPYLSIGFVVLMWTILIAALIALILKSSRNSSPVRARPLSLKDIRIVLTGLIDIIDLAYPEGEQLTSLLLKKTLLIMAAGLQEEGAKALSQVFISFVERKAEEIASTLDEIGEVGRPPVPFPGDYVPGGAKPWNYNEERPVFRNGILVGFLSRRAPLEVSTPFLFRMNRSNVVTDASDEWLEKDQYFRFVSHPLHPELLKPSGFAAKK